MADRRVLKARGVGVACVLLCLLNVVVFLPLRSFDFVNYDDGAYVTNNQHVLAGLTAEGVRWAFHPESCTVTGNWHPLTWLSLMLDVSLFGADPGAMHLTNLALHIGNTLLLFQVMWKLTGAYGRSLFVSAVFAVHPLHVESVAWISERKDVLSTLFAFVTMLAHLRYVELHQRRWQIAAAISLALSLMSKQMYVTLPVILLVTDYWPLQRMRRDSPSSRDLSDTRPLLRLVTEKLPYFFIAAAFAVVAFAGQRLGGAVASFSEYPLADRLLNACVAVVMYLWKTVCPINLAVFYPYPRSGLLLTGLASATALSLLSYAIARQRRQYPAGLAGWLWFCISLLPVIGIVQIGRQSMADRYMYFPMIGLLIAVTWSVPVIAKPHWQRYLRSLAIAAVILLAVLARRQTYHWRNTMELFTQAAAVAESSLAYTKLGFERAQQQRPDAAMNYLHRALRLDPDYTAAHSSMGNVLLMQGKLQAAVRHFQKVIELEPDHAEAHYNLGIIYMRLGQWQNAEQHYTSALNSAPNNAEVHLNLGVNSMLQSKTVDAERHWQKALQLNAELPEAHFMLGQVYLSQPDRASLGVEHLQRGLALQPESPKVHGMLADHYERTGDDALMSYHRQRAGDLKGTTPVP